MLFFDSLAKTGSGSSRASASAAAGASAANPVYNLLPDCLSKLLSKANLTEEQVQVIMGQLLAYVKVGHHIYITLLLTLDNLAIDYVECAAAGEIHQQPN